MFRFLQALVARVLPHRQDASRRFVHLVGDFDQMALKRDGRNVRERDVAKVPPKGKISGYTRVDVGNTTYVLWNSPDDVQREIQRGRKNHFDLGDMRGRVLDLAEKKWSVSSICESFSSSALPERQRRGPRPAVSEEFMAASHAFREKLACVRAERGFSSLAAMG